MVCRVKNLLDFVKNVSLISRGNCLGCICRYPLLYCIPLLTVTPCSDCRNEWLVFSVQWRLGRFASTGGRICAATAESRWGTTDKTGAVLSATTARQPGLRCKRKDQICWHTQNNIPSRTCISTLSSCSSGTLLVFGNFFYLQCFDAFG